MTTWGELKKLAPFLEGMLRQEELLAEIDREERKRGDKIEWSSLRRLADKQAWREWLNRRTPTVRARLARMNPNGVTPGGRVAGWYPQRTLREIVNMDVCGKRRFVGQFGREAWENLPASAFFKSGRRKYVTHYAIMSRAWESGGAMPMQAEVAA